MSSKYVIANWKLNGSRAFVRQWLTNWSNHAPSFSHLSAVLCPPCVYLGDCSSQPFLSLGAQDLSPRSSGAFTGEVSSDMLYDMGCRYVIVGHSERRLCFHETTELLSAKIEQAMRGQLVPIFCVGETFEQHQKKETLSVLFDQIHSVLNALNVSLSRSDQVILAYEPIWAIGSGQAADFQEVCQIFRELRRFLDTNWGAAVSASSLLYGGSVSPQNVSGFLPYGGVDIDGFLVGSSSLDADCFRRICEMGEAAWTLS